MDSYLVRIYRRAERKPGILVGTVERTGTERKVAFSSADELWEMLRCREWPTDRASATSRPPADDEKPMDNQ